MPTEMEANLVIFALMFITILMIAVVKIPLLMIFSALIFIIVGATFQGTSAFPWLNLALIIMNIYSMVQSFSVMR